MKAINVINENLVNLSLQSKDRKEVVKELAELLFREGCLEDKEEFIESVYYRESVASTYCGFEVAIPHGICKAVKKPSLCFGRTTGFDWDGDGTTPIKYVYLIAVPDNEAVDEKKNEHISILSSIATLALEDEVREEWSKVQTVDGFLKTLENV